MVEASGLLNQVNSLILPETQVFKEVVSLFLDLRPGTPKVDIAVSKLPCPVPNISIHFLVQLLRPSQAKGGNLTGEILPPKYLTKAFLIFSASTRLNCLRVAMPGIFNPETSSIGVSPGRRSSKMTFIYCCPFVNDQHSAVHEPTALSWPARSSSIKPLALESHGPLKHAR